MPVEETAIRGLYEVRGRTGHDPRGWFSVSWQEGWDAPWNFGPSSVFAHAGNPRAFTLRGLHLELSPSKQWKLVTCVAGSAFDVVADPNPESPTFGEYLGRTFNAGEDRSWLIAPGLAHGYLTLVDSTVMFYVLSRDEDRDLARGIHYLDPRFAIDWPAEIQVISERDSTYLWME